jgi:hypothetical protein
MVYEFVAFSAGVCYTYLSIILLLLLKYKFQILIAALKKSEVLEEDALHVMGRGWMRFDERCYSTKYHVPRKFRSMPLCIVQYSFSSQAWRRNEKEVLKIQARKCSVALMNEQTWKACPDSR